MCQISLSNLIFVFLRVGGTVGATITCPLEVVKTRLQVKYKLNSCAWFFVTCLSSELQVVFCLPICQISNSSFYCRKTGFDSLSSSAMMFTDNLQSSILC